MDAPKPADVATDCARGEPSNDYAGAERFERLVQRHQPLVCGLAWRLLGWPDDVDDVVQDVFLKVFKTLDSFRGQARIETWLTRITINTCRSHRRRRLLRLRVLGELAARTLHTSSRDSAADATPAGSGDESARLLRQVIVRLPMRDREVIVLRYLQEMEIADMAQVLRLGVNAVEVRLSRARQRLRRAMTDMSHGLQG
jgi:RNA polymerase sigma-70 factor (ECF subfamily)